MHDFSTIQMFLAALVIAAAALDYQFRKKIQDRYSTGVAFETSPDMPVTPPLTLSVKRTKRLPDDYATNRDAFPKDGVTKAVHVQKSTMRTLPDLLLLVDDDPAFVERQLKTYYDTDLPSYDQDMLRVCISSLMDHPSTSALPESPRLQSMRRQTAELFSDTLKKTSTLQSTLEHLGKYQGAVSPFSHSINHIAMMTGRDIGEIDDGRGFYPVERIDYLLQNAYGSRLDFGGPKVHMLVDPSPALQRLGLSRIPEGAELRQFAGAEYSLLNEFRTGFNDLLYSMYDHGYATFSFMKGEGHFVSGALVNKEDGIHLVVIDSADHHPQGDHTASQFMQRMLSQSGIHLAPGHIHDQYDCLKDHGNVVNLQRDGVSCGPWTTEILSRLTQDRCFALADHGSHALNDLILEVSGTDQPSGWTDDLSRTSAERCRHQQYRFVNESLDALQADMDHNLNRLRTQQPRR